MTRRHASLTSEVIRQRIRPAYDVVTREELLASAIPRSHIDRAMRDGTLQQLLPGVFLVSPAEPDWRRWAIARLRYVERNMRRKWDGVPPRPVAALTGTAAARIHGIPHVDIDPGTTVIACNPASRSAKSGAVLVDRDALTEEDTTEVDGARVTTLVWTVLELIAVLLTSHAKNIVADLVRDDRLSLDELRALASRAGDLGTHTLYFLRDLTEVDLHARSKGERALFGLLVGHRVDLPLVNHVVDLLTGSFELDFAWPHLMLNVELDGPHHLDPEQKARDDARDALLRAAGWEVIRISYREFEQDPEAVLRRIAAVIAELSA